jgi:hypothetical protein
MKKISERTLAKARELDREFHAPMVRKFKALWVDALRTGQFKRGYFFLFDGKRYCPLGVACELFRRFTGAGKWVQALDEWGFEYEGSIYLCQPPQAVYEFFGLDIQDVMTLSDLNDGKVPRMDVRIWRAYHRASVAQLCQFISDFCGN